jgi:hypothetical protein
MEPEVSLEEMVRMCGVLEAASIKSSAKGGLERSKMLLRYRGELRKLQIETAVQTTLLPVE